MEGWLVGELSYGEVDWGWSVCVCVALVADVISDVLPVSSGDSGGVGGGENSGGGGVSVMFDKEEANPYSEPLLTAHLATYHLINILTPIIPSN